MKTVKIENWHVTIGEDNLYTPPEAQDLHLVGHVTDHPSLANGIIQTSSIVNVDGKFVTTRSGTVYELGTPDPKYVEWCYANQVHVPTEDEPIRLIPD